MADQVPQEVEDTITEGTPVDERPVKKEKRPPVYQVFPDSKIPVAKSQGPLWKARKKQAKKAIEEVQKSWDEAIRYYENDQSGSSNTDDVTYGSDDRADLTLNDKLTETENVVFSNVTTMTPALYSRNPQAEFTVYNDTMKDLARACEKLVNELAHMKHAPGLNLKPKAKRGVVTALLTNRAWLEIGYTVKQDSSDQALADLEKLAQDLQDADDQQEIEAIEGKISALEEAVDILQPPGPFVRYRRPQDVLVDPAAMEIDLSDAQWVIVLDSLPTSYIAAKYGKEDGDDTESLYKKNKVLKIGDASEEEQNQKLGEFDLFDKESKPNDYGYEDDDTMRRSSYTDVAWVWDKVTRRLFLYNDKDWTWPLWVWDDPYGLVGFFPLYSLTFFESPCGPTTKGEVSFYIDQQDGINEIVAEKRLARQWAKRNVVFDKTKGMSQEDIDSILKGPDGTARGINVPEGMKITDLVMSIVPPSMQYKEIFDKEDYYKAINRISSVSDVLQGAQFKTNTTNDAVDANVSAANMRIDEKTDAIEDWIGEVLWGIAQLCLQFMSTDEVTAIIGDEVAAKWQQMSPDEIARTFRPQVVAGSSEKPTSKAKRSEAIQLGQVLGQFVKAAPGPVLKIMLKVLEAAFDEVSITEEDWQYIDSQIPGPPVPGQEGQTASPTAAAPGGLPQMPQAAPPAMPGMPGPTPAPGGPPQQGGIDQLLASLPTPVKAQMASAIQKGADPKAVLARVQQMVQQGGQQQPPQPQAPQPQG